MKMTTSRHAGRPARQRHGMTIKHQKSSSLRFDRLPFATSIRQQDGKSMHQPASALPLPILPITTTVCSLLSIYNMSASESTTNGHYSFPFEQSFDLEQYISRYASETRLQRLAFIAQQTANTDATMQQTANRILQHDVQQAGNLVRYKQLHPQADEHWIQTTTANNEASLQVLEARLSAAQANLNKDAIRTAFLNLADFSLQDGSSTRGTQVYSARARLLHLATTNGSHLLECH